MNSKFSLSGTGNGDGEFASERKYPLILLFKIHWTALG